MKGWPVLVHALTLPCEVQNGRGQGGTCLVGWLPYVSKIFIFSYSCFMISHLRLRRNQCIKGSHIGLISNAICITDVWTRSLSLSLNHWRKGWLSIVLITMSIVYSHSFKTSPPTWKSCKCKHFNFMYMIRLGIKLIGGWSHWWWDWGCNHALSVAFPRCSWMQLITHFDDAIHCSATRLMKILCMLRQRQKPFESARHMAFATSRYVAEN